MALRVNRLGIVISAAAIIAACGNASQMITGTPRAAISPDEVRVYTQAPSAFEEIAVLSASRRSLATGGERAIATMIETLRERAAALGANGLLLEDFSDAAPVSIGTAVSSDSVTHNGSISLGAATSVGLVKKTAKGRAIFVQPN